MNVLMMRGDRAGDGDVDDDSDDGDAIDNEGGDDDIVGGDTNDGDNDDCNGNEVDGSNKDVGLDNINPNKVGLFEGSFFWGAVNLNPLHISRRTNLISI